MRVSRGMGAIMPDKMPKKKIIHRKDDPNRVELYKKGGMVEKKKDVMLDKLQRAPLSEMVGKKEGGNVNAAGNYTKPSLRKRIVAQVKAAATHGTGAGQWSARKAQLVAKKYKAAGGGYK